MARAWGGRAGPRALHRAGDARRRRPRGRARPALRVEAVEPASVRDAVVAIYDAALESENGARWFTEWLPRHAERSDFAFLAARGDGDVLGFTYGYTGSYGQWWTDRVAQVLDERQRGEWLDPPHYEVVELHVRPDRQRQGIGSRLLDELLAGQPHDRALLTARESSSQARSFYAKHGWRELAPVAWGEGYGRSIVLGKRL